ncbi:MAG: polyprenyl synthetase family protein [Phycisphaerae bacterium]|nr:polyprenyl synthetase family protein [Phycisphaerae bacterium]
MSPPNGPDTTPGGATAMAALVEGFMAEWLRRQSLPGNLLQATEYALLGGGKRLRPILAMQCCDVVGGSVEDALPSAAAVEMIHAFSLVHDDLPALDNDDLRRGLPTVHKKYGEAMAILVGDGLMSMAFQVLCDRQEPALAGRLCRELAVGSTMMIAGQVLDTLGGFEAGLSDRSRLERVHLNKTGALIRASCRMGALAGLARVGSSDAAAMTAITAYGEAIGLMFQIVDDLVDVQQTAEHAGKRTGKDSEAGKLTYPGVVGVAAARAEVSRLHAEARKSLEPYGNKAGGLIELCDYLAVRTK